MRCLFWLIFFIVSLTIYSICLISYRLYWGVPYFTDKHEMKRTLNLQLGQNVDLSCRSRGYPHPWITWYKDQNIILLSNQNNKIFEKWTLHMDNLEISDSGMYTCKICSTYQCISHTTLLTVAGIVEGEHQKWTKLDTKHVKVLQNKSIALQCPFKLAGEFKGNQTWTKIHETDGRVTELLKKSKLKRIEDLPIKQASLTDQGWYSCELTPYDHNLNSVSGSMYLAVLSKRDMPKNVIILLTISIAILIPMVLISLYTYLKWTQARKQDWNQWSKKIIIDLNTLLSDEDDTLQLPVVRIVKNLQPNRSSTEMTSFVGYDFPQDSTWEFPRDSLNFAEVLGEGFFGKVLKAYTTGFSNDETNKTVAVKMLKDNHGDQEVINLMQEMELMKLIGKHKNIINLLGCCSTNRDLLVITEFALHGCLKSFLLNSQLYPEHTDESIRKSRGQLTNKELVTCCYEIAQGMEYLASKKCVHRDLAARNVLVSADYTMKIADFGLARDIRKYEYCKTNDEPLPWPWMSPESLRELIFNYQSDVWSFGVLAWEVMTFGMDPYELEDDAPKRYDALCKGWRWERPEGCNEQVYKLMQDCWQLNAIDRPNFARIVQRLQLLADEEIDAISYMRAYSSERKSNFSFTPSPTYRNIDYFTYYVNNVNEITPTNYLTESSVSTTTLKYVVIDFDEQN